MDGVVRFSFQKEKNGKFRNECHVIYLLLNFEMKDDMSSSIEVFIPVYNGEDYIAETIDSVLNQSAVGITLTVVDNCSTDRTQEIVSRYIAQGVRYIRHEANIGGNRNHNYCLDIAEAEFIKLLSADDVLLPGIIEAQVNALQANQNCGLATCNYLVTNENLLEISTVTNISGLRRGVDAIKICANKIANLIGNPSAVMLRKSMLGNIRFDKNFKWHADFRLFCDVLRHSDMVNVDVNGFLYRRHDLTDSELGCPVSVRIHDEVLFIRENAGINPIPRLRMLKRYRFKYIKQLLNTTL